MPTSTIDVPVLADPPRKVWTRQEYEELSSCGLFDQQKLELVGGELINKMGKKRPHGISLTLLRGWLDSVFTLRRVQQEVPIDVAPKDNPTNEPEPDIVVLNRDLTDFSKNPGPRDIELIVEIGDTTFSFDLITKGPLYARAGIVEYWILDIGGRRMIVHRDPQNGRYASVVAYGADESLAPLAAPDSRLRVGDVLPDFAAQ